MSWNDDLNLTATGAARRDSMREELARELVRVSRRRRATRRAVTATAALVLAGAGVWWAASMVPSAPHSAPPVAHVPSRPQAMSPETTRVHVEIIRDTPTIQPASFVSDRVAAADVGLSDDELLQELAELGRPTGLAVIGDRTVLTAPVTDEALRDRQDATIPPSQAG